MLPAQVPVPRPIRVTWMLAWLAAAAPVEDPGAALPVAGVALLDPLGLFTAPITCTDSPMCLFSGVVSASFGMSSLYVVPFLSVMVKFGDEPPRHPSVMVESAAGACDIALGGALGDWPVLGVWPADGVLPGDDCLPVSRLDWLGASGVACPLDGDVCEGAWLLLPGAVRDVESCCATTQAAQTSRIKVKSRIFRM